MAPLLLIRWNVESRKIRHKRNNMNQKRVVKKDWPVRLNFSTFTCSKGSEVSIKQHDKIYRKYLVDFDNGLGIDWFSCSVVKEYTRHKVRIDPPTPEQYTNQYQAVIEGLQIIEKYDGSFFYGIVATTDFINAGLSEHMKEVSSEDQKRLKKLGWYPRKGGGWRICTI